MPILYNFTGSREYESSLNRDSFKESKVKRKLRIVKPTKTKNLHFRLNEVVRRTCDSWQAALGSSSRFLQISLAEVFSLPSWRKTGA